MIHEDLNARAHKSRRHIRFRGLLCERGLHGDLFELLAAFLTIHAVGIIGAARRIGGAQEFVRGKHDARTRPRLAIS